MIYLLVASLLWSFSFGIIKTRLADLDPFMVAAIRLALSALVFAPFLRRTRIWLALKLMAIGAIQFGLMYCLYLFAYQSMKAHQVAVLTITTPLFVVFIDAMLKGRWVYRHFGAALLAVGGALLVVVEDGSLGGAFIGVCLMQGANVCFAAGQILYKRYRSGVSDVRAMGWMFIGAVCVPIVLRPPSLQTLMALEGSQWLSLAYLGLVPSALAFYLWNKGVMAVPNAVVAVMNNLKIPMAVVVAFTFFGESVDWPWLVAGSILMGLGYGVSRVRSGKAL